MTVLYVYYQVQSQQAEWLRPEVRRMQAKLRGAMPGLSASLNQRVPAACQPRTTPAAGDPLLAPTQTWMEIYHFNGHADHRAWQGLVDALDLAVAQLPAGMEGNRHVEWFERIVA